MNRIYLNDNWQWSHNGKTETVRIPHTVCESPLSYFDESCYQMISEYSRSIMIDSDWQGKTLLLTFMGAAHHSTVLVNGIEVDTHNCGYTAFTFDISSYVKYGADNELKVILDSKESLNTPPFGFVVDYMTYGGIYRDVYLEVKNKIHIEDIFIKPDLQGKRIVSQIKVAEASDYRIEQWGAVHNSREYMPLEGKLENDEYVSLTPCIKPWSPDEPNLYDIKTRVYVNDVLSDEQVTTIGFRDIEFKADGFYLNGVKTKIRGLNRHQSYPYVGYAMPKNPQIEDARILKDELGLNAVRTSHYPQSQDFIMACNELGLMVFTEIPGWQHIGDAEWKNQAVQNTEDMILQYRNHPSIILWGVRINESDDDDEFYTRTNEVAHRLDPTRPTGGVRAMKKSHLLEDVYTYNDFVHDGRTPGCEPKKNVTSAMNKAYLVSEYNGHMFPTKSYDSEEHRVEHTLRHFNVLQAVEAQKDIAGSFGWCMFDYNTHKDFGSGDRICYHGVTDMFRNSKLAAIAYKVRQDKEPVLELSSSMDIGEHPACNRGSTYIFSNADSIKMYKNDVFIKEYMNPDRKPILIDDYIGSAIHDSGDYKPKQADAIKKILNATACLGMNNLPKTIYLTAAKLVLFYHMKPYEAVALFQKYVGDWGGNVKVYRFEAYKDGKLVKSITKGPVFSTHLDVQTDHNELSEQNTYDVASIRIKMLDQNDNVLPFYNEPVSLSTEGPIELIGPSIISLKGGMGGTYVKTTGQTGKASLKITSGTETVTIDFEIM